MKVKKIYLAVCASLLALSASVGAQTAFDQKQMLRKNEPIEIVSNKMEAFQEKKMVVFSGNAVAQQGDVQLKTDRLAIYYKKADGKKNTIGKQELEVAGELDRIEAKGNVVITQKELSATGDEAIYYQDTAQFVMTGQPVLKQGRNVIKGCKVFIYVNENRGEVQKCDTENSGRVTAIIHPKDKKEETQRPDTARPDKR